MAAQAAAANTERRPEVDEQQPGGLRDAIAAPLTVTDLGAGGIDVAGTWNSAADMTAAGLPADEPTLLDMQICLAYSNGTQCTWNTQQVTIQRVPDGFAGAGPTAPAGPGVVALRTGEFSMSVTDVSAPGDTEALTVGRTHTTSQPAASTAGQVFGPGWISQFDGDGGPADLELVDNTRTDGTFALTDATGAVLTFRAPAGRRTSGTFAQDEYLPVLTDDDITAGVERRSS